MIYESKGTWFENNGETFLAKYPRIKTICCPVCQRPGPTLGGGGSSVRIVSYCESFDKNSRCIVAKAEALCLCGTSFSLETFR